MVQVYTNISKPGAQNYTNQNNFPGKQQYDESDILYDQANVFYDSVNVSQYTGISKPGAQSYTNIVKPT